MLFRSTALLGVLACWLVRRRRRADRRSVWPWRRRQRPDLEPRRVDDRREREDNPDMTHVPPGMTPMIVPDTPRILQYNSKPNPTEHIESVQAVPVQQRSPSEDTHEATRWEQRLGSYEVQGTTPRNPALGPEGQQPELHAYERPSELDSPRMGRTTDMRPVPASSSFAGHPLRRQTTPSVDVDPLDTRGKERSMSG